MQHERIDQMDSPSWLLYFTLFHNLTRVSTMKKGYSLTALQPTANISPLLPDFMHFKENPWRWVSWSRRMKPAGYFSQTKGLVKDLSSLGLRPQVSYTSRIDVPKQKNSPVCLFSKFFCQHSATATKGNFRKLKSIWQLVYFYIALRYINISTEVNQDNT